MALVNRDYNYGEGSYRYIARSPLIYLLLGFALIGVVWLSFNDVKAGSVYYGLFGFGIFVLLLSFLFIKQTDRRYEIPISTDIYSSVVLFVMGLALPLILFYIPKLFGKTEIITAKYFVPLTFGSSLVGQSYSALSASYDPFWRSFITVFTAGGVETFVVVFSAVAFGVILAFFIRKLLGILPNGLNFGETGSKWFDFIFAMIFSTIFFVVIHRLNSSYNTPEMFFMAGLFNILLCFCTYYFNLFLAFSFGFHQMNNAIAIGLKETIDGFLSSSWGILILLFYLLIFFSFVINIKKLHETLKLLYKNIGL